MKRSLCCDCETPIKLNPSNILESKKLLSVCLKRLKGLARPWTAVMPVKVTNSKKLISHDIHSNSYNYKYSYALDVVPISKGSLVFLGKKLHKTLGYISPITKKANAIHLIDPSGRVPSRRFATPSKWWFLMDVEIVRDNVKKKFPHAILELLLVKKYYDKSLRKQSRNWNANLTEVGLDTDVEADYNEFLEEDPEMR
ncbi:hypothetical protein pipiens_011869 [Culex pipiens pipiens]|uniref:Uncharacterized protein n=1 Tax=Culex pipiens pipiens TaxID=38569 RepID=A0ABD1D622_CULPP